MKEALIKRIKDILKFYGCFNISELEHYDNSPCVNSMGSVVALADYFTEDYVEISIYQTSSFSSDPIEDYEEQYENLSEDVLKEILVLCEQWEKQSEKEKIEN